jgi:hypothetical protein
MKNKVLLCAALCFISILNSCKNGPVEPDDSNAAPGRRDYTWTADTIKAYYIYFNSIWGKTANDVWAVSSVGSVFENIYRYDGTKWYRETRTPIYNTSSLWGTENNLWICCSNGRLWNYKDNIFSSSPQYKYDDKEVFFLSIAGKNDSEIYAGGGMNIPMNRETLLYKYDGSDWQLDKVLHNNGNITRVRYSAVNDKYYLLTGLDNEVLNDTVRLYEYNGKDLKIIYQNYVSENTSSVINDINGYMYVTIGHKIYRYYKNDFEQMLEIPDSNFGGQTWGRSRNDLFIRMFDGLMHYNGTDTQYILKFPVNVRFGTSALVLEKDIFLHAYDNKTGYNIIYHGKLKEN